MTKEKPIFGQVLIRAPLPKRRPRVGVPIHTGEDPMLFTEPTPVVPDFGDYKTGENPLSYSAGIDKWKEKFRDNLKAARVDQETGTFIYNQFHYTSVAIADQEIKNLKTKINENIPLAGNERFYENPLYFRDRLLSKNLRADDLYEIGLTCLRMDKIYPEKREEFISVGISLLEAAENASPNNPKFKVALWREYERLMYERRIRREKEEAKEKPKINTEAFSMHNAREVFEYGTPNYYRTEIKKWQDFLDSMIDRSKINTSLFRSEYEKFIRIGKITRDIRNYEGNKIMYKPIDFEEAYRNEDPDSFFMGLAGLYAIRKDYIREKRVEPTAFKLLAKAAELPPPRRIYKAPEPWPVFVVYVMVKEYYRLLGLTKTVSKPEAKRREFQDNYLRVMEKKYIENYKRTHGEEPPPVTKDFSLNYEEPKEDDEIPF